MTTRVVPPLLPGLCQPRPDAVKAIVDAVGSPADLRGQKLAIPCYAVVLRRRPQPSTCSPGCWRCSPRSLHEVKSEISRLALEDLKVRSHHNLPWSSWTCITLVRTAAASNAPHSNLLAVAGEVDRGNTHPVSRP